MTEKDYHFSAKHAKEWDQDDLEKYKIKVVPKTFQAFFGRRASGLLEGIYATASEVGRPDETNWNQYQPETLQFLAYALDNNLEEEKALDYAAALLSFTGYTAGPRHIGRRRKAQWLSCGVFMDVDYPLVVYRFRKIVLPVWWAPSLEIGTPEIIAQAIATRANQIESVKKDTVMPGILIVDGFPHFFKIPVATKLIGNIGQGMRPAKDTIVETYSPTPDDFDPVTDNMRNVNLRRSVIQSMLAFKQFVSD
ncbi:hypothetical protein HYPSUDRAFT_201148 [Hypholoma sublateritium FD-334 SS-4]|uniref:Uncharacterized protein n=1 Tax=Hypholoma sublateritium (strain FD-334 SS-4) TaxID=945553 RepID=A0A0D2MJ89_HYPSF|nr:hypothetical protein HYPSUDRAFT_201148 [Hypholoma sublateritium FD-334 SS-4]